MPVAKETKADRRSRVGSDALSLDALADSVPDESFSGKAAASDTHRLSIISDSLYDNATESIGPDTISLELSSDDSSPSVSPVPSPGGDKTGTLRSRGSVSGQPITIPAEDSGWEKVGPMNVLNFIGSNVPKLGKDHPICPGTFA